MSVAPWTSLYIYDDPVMVETANCASWSVYPRVQPVPYLVTGMIPGVDLVKDTLSRSQLRWIWNDDGAKKRSIVVSSDLGFGFLRLTWALVKEHVMMRSSMMVKLVIIPIQYIQIVVAICRKSRVGVFQPYSKHEFIRLLNDYHFWRKWYSTLGSNSRLKETFFYLNP